MSCGKCWPLSLGLNVLKATKKRHDIVHIGILQLSNIFLGMEHPFLDLL